jgi:uncharacterized protein (DUF2336 family)
MAGTAGAEAAEDTGYAESPYAFIVEKLRKMTVEEFRESLVRAGILDRKGRLMAKYRR